MPRKKLEKEFDYECPECGAEFDRPKVEMQEHPADRHTLVEVKLCPECGEELD